MRDATSFLRSRQEFLRSVRDLAERSLKRLDVDRWRIVGHAHGRVRRGSYERRRGPLGHRPSQVRIGIPDPRVATLAQFATLLKKHPHYDFARSVEEVTTGKNGSLILNVDGVIAAVLIDIFVEVDGLTAEQLQEMLDIEFFNALFVIPRTVGFIAHFMEQKRNDEGLFRLPDDLLFIRDTKPKDKPDTR